MQLAEEEDQGRKLAGVPVAMSTRLARTWLTAFVKPVVLLGGAPMTCPVESMNCASAHSVATVVSSLMVTDAGSVLDIPATPINPIAVLVAGPATPPSATR